MARAGPLSTICEAESCPLACSSTLADTDPQEGRAQGPWSADETFRTTGGSSREPPATSANRPGHTIRWTSVGRDFDLNVERVLEHWTVAHAIRELIANALDEAALTSTADPQIVKDRRGLWHVRDWGRGLRYEHLTQKENREKLNRPDLVGKFGVGLKDALATFDRRGIEVVIDSRHHRMTLKRTAKHGFEDLKTLHVAVDPASDPNMVGTDVSLPGVKDDDIAEAKSLFLRFAGDEVLERTRHGAVLRRSAGAPSRIYVNGLRVAEEERFLFSYDVTSVTAPLRRALNRERTNVGRTAYADRVKAILLAATSTRVADALAADLEGFATGKLHDETSWLDVALHACRILNASQKVLFLTAREIFAAPASVHHARDDGYRIVTVPEDLRHKLANARDIAGNPIIDLYRYTEQFNQSFSFRFIEPNHLTPAERAVFSRTDAIITLQGNRPRELKLVRISETMRMDAAGASEVIGLWDPTNRQIVIRRDQLADIARYAGSLLHEVTHAATGTSDLSVGFEDALTGTVGVVATRSLGDKHPEPVHKSSGRSGRVLNTRHGKTRVADRPLARHKRRP